MSGGLAWPTCRSSALPSCRFEVHSTWHGGRRRVGWLGGKGERGVGRGGRRVAVLYESAGARMAAWRVMAGPWWQVHVLVSLTLSPC